jgi:hypothetical protein
LNAASEHFRSNAASKHFRSLQALKHSRSPCDDQKILFCDDSTEARVNGFRSSHVWNGIPTSSCVRV